MIPNHNNKLAADVFMHIVRPGKGTMKEWRGRELMVEGIKSEITGHEGVAPFKAVVFDLYEDCAGLTSDLHTMLSHGKVDDSFLEVMKMKGGDKVWSMV